MADQADGSGDPYGPARDRYGATKDCPPCGRSHSLEDFTIKNSDKGLLQSRCKAAVRAYAKAWYAANTEAHVAAGAARKTTVRMATAAKLAEFLAGHRCASCGCPEDLTAVLTGPGTRGRSPRALVRDGWAWARLEPLLAQAAPAGLVLCAFCVRRHPRS